MSFVLLRYRWLCSDTICSNVVEVPSRLIYPQVLRPLGVLFEGGHLGFMHFYNQQEWSRSEVSRSSIQSNTPLCCQELSPILFHREGACPQVAMVAPEPSLSQLHLLRASPAATTASPHSEKGKHKAGLRPFIASGSEVFMRTLSLSPNSRTISGL